MNPLQVSQINYYIEEHLRTDPVLRKIRVVGELANLRQTNQWSFFHLKDENAMLACVSFQAIEEKMVEGNEYIVTGAVRYYSKRGTLRLHVESVEISKKEERAIQRNLQFEEMKKRGLFINQRSLKKYPTRIGLITSKDGAAIDDVRKNIERRYPFVELIVVPVLVQGEQAAEAIQVAFRRIARQNVDCVILTRGGGDTSDLEVFDDMVVVESVFQSKVPVIVAIGHEKDWTFAEFAADARASTPTGAAELVVPTISQIRQSLLEEEWKARVEVTFYLKQIESLQAKYQRVMIREIEQRIGKLSLAFSNQGNRIFRECVNQLDTWNRFLAESQETEVSLSKQWEQFRFLLQDEEGYYARNDHKLLPGVYQLHGLNTQQKILLVEEEENGKL